MERNSFILSKNPARQMGSDRGERGLRAQLGCLTSVGGVIGSRDGLRVEELILHSGN